MCEPMQAITAPSIYKSKIGDFVYGEVYKANHELKEFLTSHGYTIRDLDYFEHISRLNLWKAIEDILDKAIKSSKRGTLADAFEQSYKISRYDDIFTTIAYTCSTTITVWPDFRSYYESFMYRLLSDFSFMVELNNCENEDEKKELILYEMADMIYKIIVNSVSIKDPTRNKVPMSNSSIIVRDETARILNITHTDNDGYFCAGVLWTILNRPSINREYNFDVYTTGYNPDFDKITELINNSDEIWITDLNYGIDTLKKMIDIKPNARWYYIDHHDRHFNTDQEYIDFVCELDTLFDDFIYNPTSTHNDRSACKLLANRMNDISFGYPINMEYINYVAAWDTRSFDIVNEYDTFVMHYGMSLRDYNPTTRDGLECMRDILYRQYMDGECYKDIINNDMTAGKAILSYKTEQNKRWVKSASFEFVLTDEDGVDYNGIAYNYIGDSYCFPEDVMDKYDICCTFRVNKPAIDYRNQTFIFTMYSNKPNVNCGKLCKYIYNGGGHPGAAGFVSTGFPFEPIDDVLAINKYRMITGFMKEKKNAGEEHTTSPDKPVQDAESKKGD